MPDARRDNAPRPDGFLPDFCTIKLVLGALVTAELIAAVITLAAGDIWNFWQGLGLRSLFVQWVMLASVAILCPLRRFLNGRGHTQAGLLAWGITLAIALITAEIAWRAPFFSWPADADHLAFLLQTLAMTAIVAALLLRYLYEHYRQRQRELAETRSRLHALQARIRPHFLFNSMNTIANLTREDPRLAEEAVQDLSDLFRASLREANLASSLEQELELVRGYLRIERHRMADRLRVSWDLAPELPMDAAMPSLILQPLVENAVIHGAEASPEGGEILITGRFARGKLNISVRNSVQATDESGRRRGFGLAQQNIRDRLSALYGDEAGLTLSRVDGQYQARMHFPYRGEIGRGEIGRGEIGRTDGGEA